MSIKGRTIDPDRTSAGRVALVGFLAIQIALGYEWLISGLTKIVRGGFPAGLADELREKSVGTAAWYKGFLDGTVIPHGVLFGYLVELGELLVGIALIAAALIWIFRWDRLTYGWRSAVLLATAFAALAAIALNVNFHLANGSPHPYLIPVDGFDEGVDLDSLMPAIQVVLFVVSGWFWLALRRGRRSLTQVEAPRPVAEDERRPVAV